jgi:predicted RNA-binding Zn-ribbon protein involved in translation (DUF1610 family)
LIDIQSIGEKARKEVNNEKSKNKEPEILETLTTVICPNCKERVIAWDGRCPRCGHKVSR